MKKIFPLTTVLRLFLNILFAQNNCQILTNPTDQFVSPGQTARFSVTSIGDTEYQWTEKVNIFPVLITNGGKYSGAESKTLTITNVTASMNGNIYQCSLIGTDDNPCSGFNFSTEATLNLTSSINNLEALKVKVFPNPVSELLTVDLSNSFSSADLYIYDALGKICLQQKLSQQENTVNFAELAKGVYSIEVRDVFKSGRQLFIKE